MNYMGIAPNYKGSKGGIEYEGWRFEVADGVWVTKAVSWYDMDKHCLPLIESFYFRDNRKFLL